MKTYIFIAAMLFASTAMASVESNDSTRTKDKKLKTATVVAQRRVVRSDGEKITYDAAADPASKTESVLDILRKVPMVTVDGEDNIKVKGSSSFKVYVDGKPNTMISADPSKVLKNYPATAISKVEVISDPGAKYDGEGVTGILNIVTNKKMYTSGWSLTPSIKVGTQDCNLGFNGMTKMDKLTLSSYYYQGIGHQKRHRGISDYEFKNNPTFSSLHTDGYAKPDYDYQIGALEGSYEFDPHNLLSVSAGLHNIGVQYDADSKKEMFGLSHNSIYSYNLLEANRMRNISINASADYQHTFKKEGEMLTLSYRFSNTPSLNRTLSTYTNIIGEQYIASTLTNKKVRPENDSYEHTAQLDFTTPVAKGQTFSTGTKFVSRTNESDTKQWNSTYQQPELWTPDPLKSLHYRHNNNIYAAYMEYNLKAGKFGATTGLRYEFDHINVKYVDGKRPNFSKDLSDLLPSVKLNYNLKETEILKFSFNSRIGRPGISMLSPYVIDNDGLNISYGNPNLNSERGYNFTLGYGNFSQKFSINAELGAMINNNGLTDYKIMDQNIINTTYENFLHSRSGILSLYINWMPTKTTTITLNGEGGYKHFEVKRINAVNHGWASSCNLIVQQRLPWKLKASAFMGYFGKDFSLQGHTNEFTYHSLSLTRSFLKEDRLSITLTSAMFAKPNFKWTDNIETDTYSYTNTTRHNNFQLSLNASWRFGKLQAMVKKTQRSIKNEDTVTKKDDKGGMGSIGM